MEENKNKNKKEDAVTSKASENKKTTGAFATLSRWFKRTFFGGANALYNEMNNGDDEEKKDDDIFAVEKIESPGKQRVKAFFQKKLAVGALVVFLAMFLLMLVGPFIYPIDLSYIETSQQNVAPGLNMMSVPKEMKGQIKTISSNSTFSVGLSEDGNVYVWGHTKTLLSDVSKIPEEVKNANIIHVAAGTDHIIAVGDDGKVYGWGQNANGQYGPIPEGNATLGFLYTFAPSDVLNGNLDPAQIKQVVCGKQVSGIVMNDGKFYIWGNHSIGATNLAAVKKYNNVEKLVFTTEYAVLLLKDGTYSTDGTSSFDYTYVDVNGVSTRVKLRDYIEENGRKVVDIGAAGSSAAFVLDDGTVLVSGVCANGENIVPQFAEGEKIVNIMGGQKHYVALTDKGTVYSWGSNTLKQSKVPSGISGVSEIFVGPFQTYAVDAEGDLIDSWGLKGYLMGTDNFGRDIWERIVNGGRLTMTVGAIAVIISSIIGIIVGCLSGYFGGWLDMLLMRIAEVVSAIPFMPFALILSLIVATMGLSEITRIILIMVILGVLSWPGLARLVRGQVLAEREKEFVTAAKAMGVVEWKIAFKHILPNVISIIIVSMTLDFASCMLTESSLSYLGFGVALPRPTWGNMLNGSSNSVVIQNYWWQWLFPAIFLMITTICINIIGDALRDVMDPKSSQGR